MKGFAFPILLVVAFSKTLDWEAWTLWLLVPIMIFETWRYLTLRYWISDDELVVTEGVLVREERHIPLARIQTVDSTQNLLQRMLGVVEVRVETAGSSKPEAHLKVLSVAARDELRKGIFLSEHLGAPLPPQAPTSKPVELMRTGPGELALLGLNLGRGLALLAITFGLTAQLGLIDELYLGRGVEWSRQLFSDMTQGGIWIELLFELLLAVVLVFLVFALSVGSVWVRLYDFRLERHGDEFRTQCGLFTRHTTTIPKGRVQFVSIQAPLSLRIFGRALVKVRTAGGRGQGDKTSATRQWLIPVLAEQKVAKLVQEFVPGYIPSELKWHPIAPGGKRRLVIKAALSSVLFSSPLWFFWESWGALAFSICLPALLALFTSLAWVRAGRLAWADIDNAFLIREGVLTHRIAIVPRDRVQSTSLSQSPFDRRWYMARLSVDTAGADIGHRARLSYLDCSVARSLSSSLAQRAEFLKKAPVINTHPPFTRNESL